MTPDPRTLVERVRALGIAIRADGDTVVLAPRGAVPPDLRAELLAAKPAVLAVLRATSAPLVAPTAELRAAYRRRFTLTVAQADGIPLDWLDWARYPPRTGGPKRMRARATEPAP